MKKILLIVILFIFTTGCTYEYDLTVTHDKLYKEKIVFTYPTDKLNLSGKKLKTYVKEEIAKYRKSDIYNDYKFDYKIKDDKVFVTVSALHKTFEAYQTSPFYKEYFQRIYKIEGNNYFVSTGGAFTNPNLGPVLDPEFKTEPFNINVKFQNDVASTNADSSNKKNGEYTWTIKPTDEERYIEFSLTDKVKYDIVLMDFINDNIYVIVPITILVIAILVASITIFSRYKLNNRI